MLRPLWLSVFPDQIILKVAKRVLKIIYFPKFNTVAKGELVELRADLCSDVTLLRKEAMKKVIAGMTIGKDVSPLFAEVLMCIQTDDLELKKLVYLYLMNYAKTQPELALLAINTFIKVIMLFLCHFFNLILLF